MYQGDIIDSHMHFWDLKNPGYDWLDLKGAFFGDGKLKKDFLISDYFKVSQNQKVKSLVHIQCYGFPEDPSLETKWLQELHDRSGHPSAIVGYCKLNENNAEDVLKKHSEYPNFRGIRMILGHEEGEELNFFSDSKNMIQDKAFKHGFSLLSKFGLSFDVQIFASQLNDLYHFAKEFNDIKMIINHIAWPNDLSDDGYKAWQEGIDKIGNLENTYMKLSGFGCLFRENQDEDLMIKYIKYILDSFGVDKVMFGSNVPPCMLFQSYDQLCNIVKVGVDEVSQEDQKKIFFENAKRAYRMIF